MGFYEYPIGDLPLSHGSFKSSAREVCHYIVLNGKLSFDPSLNILDSSSRWKSRRVGQPDGILVLQGLFSSLPIVMNSDLPGPPTLRLRGSSCQGPGPCLFKFQLEVHRDSDTPSRGLGPPDGRGHRDPARQPWTPSHWHNCLTRRLNLRLS